MRTPGDQWTDEQIRIASMMHRAGKPYEDIAREIGRSTTAVKHYINKARRRDPVRWRPINHGKRSGQPCWDCFYGGGRTDPKTHWKCPWCDRLKPVEGWTATQIAYRIYDSHNGLRMSTTYEIQECPHFKEE